MSNMSYCRFHNTSIDFAECMNVLEELFELDFDEESDDKLSESEQVAAVNLLTRAQGMLVAIATGFDKDVSQLTTDDFMYMVGEK